MSKPRIGPRNAHDKQHLTSSTCSFRAYLGFLGRGFSSGGGWNCSHRVGGLQSNKIQHQFFQLEAILYCCKNLPFISPVRSCPSNRMP